LNKSITVYGNIFLNDVAKLAMATKSLTSWSKYLGPIQFHLRVRGEYSQEFSDLVHETKHSKHFSVVLGSEYKVWRNQTLNDLKKLTSDYVLIFLEDHIPSPDAPSFERIYNEIAELKLDIFQYSWFPQYEKWRKFFEANQKLVSPSIAALLLTKDSVNEIMKRDYRWIISITGIYKRNYLMEILNSSYPIIKKTNPRAPFDLEKSPRSKKFLPCYLGLPKTELGVCVDDDNTVIGSSALSRGMVSLDSYSRIANHHSKNSPLSTIKRLKKYSAFRRLLDWVPIRLKTKLGNALLIPTYVINSIEYYILNLSDMKTRRKSEKKIVDEN
jgi:hypothetical protein